MKTHKDLTDNELVHAFKACSLAPAIFTHEAHLRMAWLYLKHYGLEGTLVEFPRDLKAYVDHFGVSGKYHETLTQAAIRAVSHFMQRSAASDFPGFISEFSRLKTHFRELMAAHYGNDIFNSSRARSEYIEPDLLPFT